MLDIAAGMGLVEVVASQVRESNQWLLLPAQALERVVLLDCDEVSLAGYWVCLEVKLLEPAVSEEGFCG